MSRRKFMVDCKPFNCETLGWSFDCVCVQASMGEEKETQNDSWEKLFCVHDR